LVALETQIQLIGEREESLAEFAWVRTSFCLAVWSMVEIIAMGLP
jgi:hypothetical protein